MEDQINLYENQRIDLDWLISSLESLLNILDMLPPDLRRSMKKNWGVLEDVYSVAVVREEAIDKPENIKIISDAIGSMKVAIKDARSLLGL